MSRWLKGLNPEQKQAVETIHGPLLVLAGAGSGKTRVITHRIAYMIEQGIQPQNILAVTFTNKAAGEMRQRLRKMVGRAASKVTMSTFHSLGLLILREEYKNRGHKQAFTIFETTDQQSCIRELTRYHRLERSLDLGAVLGRISSYKNDFLLPTQLPKAKDEYDEAAHMLYPLYIEQLQAFAAVDFDDLVVTPTRLMEDDPACRTRWEERFRYVLVDEYQDTNTAQMRMLKAIAGGHRNVCVVGDDDQSIYGWRGAKVENILNFDRDFAGGKTIYLMRNYRSMAAILDVANVVIKENKVRHPKQMLPTREQGDPVMLALAPDGDVECRWIAQHIESQIINGIYSPNDIAVLYRSNNMAREIEAELRSMNIPYRVVGGTSFFDRKEVKDLIAYFKFCINPNDEISLRRIINYPARGIGPKTVEQLSAWSQEQREPLYIAMEKADEFLESERAKKAIGAFREVIERNKHNMDKLTNLNEVVELLIKDIGLYEDIKQGTASSSGKAFERRWGNVTGFMESLRSYMRKAEKPTMREFINQIALMDFEPDHSKNPGEVVTLSTLHGSKGLEFPLVILAGMEEGILPHDRTLNPQATDHIVGEIDEERRLCYVGITRAQDQLIMTRCVVRMLRGKEQPRTPSRFLDSIPDHMLKIKDLDAAPNADERAEMLAELSAQLGW